MPLQPLRFAFGAFAAAAMVAAVATRAQAAQGGSLEVIIVDAQTRQPLAARMHLKNSRGRPVRVRGKNLLVYGDHLIIDGQANLDLRRGQYTFMLDAGPEYKPRTGHFRIDDHADDEETIEMHRFVDLAEEGWWAGDLFAVRLLRHADPLMRAEDVRVLPLVVPAEGRRRSEAARQRASQPQMVSEKRIAAIQSVYVEDKRGAIVVHNIQPDGGGKLPLSSMHETASAIEYAEEQGCHIDVAFAASWDLPLWIAGGHVDSIQVLDSTAQMDGVRPLPLGCRKPDRSFFPGPTGQGRWAERIYFHLLNCGLRIPPSAASGSGVTSNPPGHSRVYVHTDGDLDYEMWWSNLRAGRVFVSNGPLLRPHVRGLPPGHVFHLDAGETTELEIGLDLATRDRIPYLQIIKNGEVESEVRLEKWAEAGGRLPPLRFDDSGWFLVRAATDNPRVYQHATTGPYFVESGYSPRISHASVQFFLDWLDELEARERLEKRLTEEREARISTARDYWNDLFSKANAP